VRRQVATLVLAAVVLIGAPAAAEEPEAQQSFAEDDEGRSFRTGFDPGSRIVIGGGYRPLSALSGEPELDIGYLEVGVRYRHRIDFEQGLIVWKLYHQALWANIDLGSGTGPRLRATAYRGRLVRWAEDGRLVLPSSPPRAVPFPLNVGVETTVGQIDYREQPHGFSSEIGVIRSEVVLDLWRQRRLGSYAQLGVGPRYDLWLLDDPLAKSIEAHHLVAPFTSGSFTFHHEAADGHHAFDAQLAAAHRLQVDRGWSPMVTASVSYEALLIAINDLPVSSYLASDYQFRDDPLVGRSEHELRGSLGLRLGLPID
jgi:hypothetical protein